VKTEAAAEAVDAAQDAKAAKEVAETVTEA
jgi:hypothetical protein